MAPSALARMMETRRDLSTRPLVVIVDDDDAVRDSLQFALQIEGFTVRTYSSPWTVLKEGLVPDCGCLVVDQSMPEITGLDLIARLREQNMLAPAILITSHLSATVRERAASAGVPIVEKPLLGSTLSDRIRQSLAQQSA
ncbi:MAG: response regulator [Rhizobiales bacterium]|nr:response regulator [Hyphomicrobiales bacterium]